VALASRRFQLSQSVATDPCWVTHGGHRLPALKELEKALGMLLLVIWGFKKEERYSKIDEFVKSRSLIIY
jgi:hypothetical protein